MTDGTMEGTHRIASQPLAEYFDKFVFFDQGSRTILFSMKEQLWQSNGKPDSAILVGNFSNQKAYLTPFRGAVYFIDRSNNELFKWTPPAVADNQQAGEIRLASLDGVRHETISKWTNDYRLIYGTHSSGT